MVRAFFCKAKKYLCKKNGLDINSVLMAENNRCKKFRAKVYSSDGVGRVYAKAICAERREFKREFDHSANKRSRKLCSFKIYHDFIVIYISSQLFQ